MSALLDIWDAVKHLVLVADPITIGIALVVVLIAGLSLKAYKNLLNATVIALLGFAAVKYLDAVLRHGFDPLVRAADSWNGFADARVLDLMAYVLVFAALIALVRAISSAVNK